MNIEEIKERLIKNFPKDKVEVFDSRGTGDHFSIIVISDKFEGISLVDRHRTIYSIFQEEITKFREVITHYPGSNNPFPGSNHPFQGSN